MTKESNKPIGISDAALGKLERAMPQLISLVQDKLGIDLRYCTPETECLDDRTIAEVNTYFSSLLITSYRLGLYRAMAHDFASIMLTMESRGIKPDFFKYFLQTWNIAINSVIDPPYSLELTEPLDSLVQQLPALDAHKCPAFTDLDTVSQELLTALQHNDPEAVISLLIKNRSLFDSLLAMLDGLFIPVMTKLGLMWQCNQISTAEEHLSTVIMKYGLYALGEIETKRRSLKQKALLCCPEGEEHDFGLEMLSVLLRSRGWKSFFIGHSAPNRDLLAKIAKESPDIVFISVSMIPNLISAISLIQQIKQSHNNIKVVIGGFATIFASDALAITDLVAKNLADGLAFTASLEDRDA